MGMDIQSKIRVALGTMKDHASIGKAMMYNHHHQHDGFSSIEIAVLRATNHDNGTIDDKYMHEILFLVSNSPNSIPFLAERISRRLSKTKDPLVSLKTLVLIHRLLRGGNRSFEKELCKSHVSGHLQIMCNNSDPFSSVGNFLQNYASYLEERMSWLINQAGKLEPVVVMSKGLEFRSYDEKKYFDMAFRTLPKCQVLIDKVLECSPPHEIFLSFDHHHHHNHHHGLAHVAMSNTLRESFQVYMTFSEGIAALVNMFFDLTVPARGLACDILRKASVQSQRLHDLYENCKQMVENKNLEYPCVEIISMSHVMALDQFGIGCPQNQLAASSHVSMSKPPPISTEIEELEVEAKGSKKGEEKIIDMDLSPRPNLFSWTLETKISKVWVVFEDEVPINESKVLLPAQQKLGVGGVNDVSDMESEYGRPKCIPQSIF